MVVLLLSPPPPPPEGREDEGGERREGRLEGGSVTSDTVVLLGREGLAPVFWVATVVQLRGGDGAVAVVVVLGDASPVAD